MADTNQEQLLTEVLREIRTADDPLSAAGLEPHVLAAWDARRRARPKPRAPSRIDAAYGYGIVIAAAILMAVAFSVRRAGNETLPAVSRPAPFAAAANVPIALPAEFPEVRPTPASQGTDQKKRASATTESPMEFFPLVPMTREELAGPFQIVRVQMPRASLGAMAPPFEHPNPFVEADLLLGEDGMARAIRVSTGQSADPWRSR
jgi:hypothetical protein